MRLTATEHEEQSALFEWASLNEAQYPELRLMYAIPNGGLRNIVVARKLKAEGVKSGVPDICLPIARLGYHGLYIEMKALHGPVQTAQRQWKNDLADEGYMVCICWGWDAARRVLLTYLT